MNDTFEFPALEEVAEISTFEYHTWNGTTFVAGQIGELRSESLQKTEPESYMFGTFDDQPTVSAILDLTQLCPADSPIGQLIQDHLTKQTEKPLQPATKSANTAFGNALQHRSFSLTETMPSMHKAWKPI